jgi:hypothetical protein
MIYDCFSFFNELWMLDIRLATLDPIVDRFVIAESTLTHAGQPKPLYFLEHKHEYAKYEHKISHIIVDDMPTKPMPIENVREWQTPAEIMAWTRENHQRNALSRGLIDLKTDDYVVLADVDELPRPELIAYAVCNRIPFSTLWCELFYYYLNLKSTINWKHPQIFRADQLTTCLEDMRTNHPPIKDFFKAGWHFTWQGGEQGIFQKLEAFAHQSLNCESSKIAIPRAIKKRTRFFDGLENTDDPMSIVPLSELPAYVVANREKYQHMLLPESAAVRFETMLPE